jgi:sterol desaturase/sphingolipid hydroxylase (fatty acid hydroxylase superfamily)
MILGFPLETIASFLLLRGVWAAYIHSNVRLPIGPLRWFIGAPELHHWHHDRDRDVGNYANLCPLMDILFGTYHCPGHEPERFGIREPTPRTYWGYMIQPLLPRRAALRGSRSAVTELITPPFASRTPSLTPSN